jgi:hypothetical protein
MLKKVMRKNYFRIVVNFNALFFIYPPQKNIRRNKKDKKKTNNDKKIGGVLENMSIFARS